VIERAAGKWQGASVSDFKVDTSIAIPALRMLNIGTRKIYAAHAPNPGVPGKREAQTACAAPDIQDAFRARNLGEVDEQGRQAAAPSSHLELVPITIRRNERR
jgi:hypothetical protein